MHFYEFGVGVVCDDGKFVASTTDPGIILHEFIAPTCPICLAYVRAHAGRLLLSRDAYLPVSDLHLM